MDVHHHNLATTKPVVAIDRNFIDELLAILWVVESKEPSRTEFKPICRTAPLVLLDLPNEILLSIFEHIEDDLYTLAQLSRRLHHLALPIYLAHKGMSPFTGELVLFDERSEDVLQALSIALFRPTLKCVWCTFNFERPVLKYVRGLVRLVERLEVLHETHLDFTNLRRFGNRDRISVDADWRERVAEATGDAEMEGVDVDWAMEFQVLLDAILAKGCTTLTVCLSGWGTFSCPEELASFIPSAGRFSWCFRENSVMGCLASGIRNLLGKGKEATTRPRMAGLLETFNLHSAMLLQAELCTWTIRTLNTSSISTLSLRNLDIHPEAWAIILPSIALPLLSALSIDLCSIRYPELSVFLQRHPHVQRLYLGRSLREPPSEDLPPSDFLRNATHLSAAPAYLNHLLTLNSSLPALKELSIITRVHHGRHFDFGIMNNTLLPIVPRLLGPSRVELTLELSFESSSDDWMLLDVAPDTRLIALMQYISRLDLHIAQYRLPTEVVARLPRWMGLFPALKEVVMRSPSQDGPTEPGERLAYISAIFKRCPRLEVVGINGVMRDLDGWVTQG
ncbi:hypothetical protein FPV67DRAFT_292767 [Lyophyllum atratum]|nr:hypothetical protein FPV67DRAFT_292767 [Lyophyllum atratum]